jgi:hypothetical protein
MNRPTLQEQLDVCRSAADATGDSNLRELAEAIEKDPKISQKLTEQIAFDRRLASELASLALPTDLKVRLQAAFQQGAARQTQDRVRLPMPDQAIAAAESSEPKIAEPKPRVARRRKSYRAVVAVALSICALLLIYPILNFTHSDPGLDLTEAQFCERALQLSTSGVGAWNADASSAPPHLAWNNRVISLKGISQPLRWKRVDGPGNGDWIVWELNSLQGERVYLLATDARWKPLQLPQSLSKNPKTSSGTWSVGAWQSNGIAYALVVEGNAGRFRQLTPQNSVAVRNLRPYQHLALSGA